MKKVVVIGGGTGTFTILSGLRAYPFELAAIVTTADDGGSTGILRDELGVLPPGDFRQALVALAADSSIVRELFNYRFNQGSLDGHSFGNLFLSALEKVTGSFDQAVLEAGKVLNIKGEVIPVTRDPVRLRGETTKGDLIKGEHNIEQFIWSEKAHITRLWLEPACTVHPLAVKTIRSADLIVFAPGSTFTSLIPNLLVDGMTEALQTTKAPIVFIANLMTEKGQAEDYYVQDFVELIEKYLGEGQIDFVVYNTRMPESDLLDRYKKEMERIPVRLDRRRVRNLSYKLIGENLVARKVGSRSANDKLSNTRTLIRHDSFKLGQIIYALTAMKEVRRYLKEK
jgi:uncharacterized cofD-like protein